MTEEEVTAAENGGFDEYYGESIVGIKTLNPQEMNTEIKRLTKSARNRVYAQTSRARHRL